ncbi:MAG: phosphotransferase [Treponema sp.]|nr:phosphotransferase [Treponema sp.]
MIFDGSEKIIGQGAQAKVFLYHNFAYKVYNSSYPAEWILFEKHQQKEINKAGLCPIKYYDTDDTHIIKMDLIKGDTLEAKINECIKQNSPEKESEIINYYKLLAEANKFVHSAKTEGLKIPRLYDTAAHDLSGQDKEKVLSIIEELSGRMKECICHLDLHFLNIMLPHDGSGYRIIDWINARIAPAIFDYARTFVIFGEFSKPAQEAYRQLVLPDLWAAGVSEDDFLSASQACTILRQQEKGIGNASKA